MDSGNTSIMNCSRLISELRLISLPIPLIRFYDCANHITASLTGKIPKRFSNDAEVLVILIVKYSPLKSDQRNISQKQKRVCHRQLVWQVGRQNGTPCTVLKHCGWKNEEWSWQQTGMFFEVWSVQFTHWLRSWRWQMTGTWLTRGVAVEQWSGEFFANFNPPLQSIAMDHCVPPCRTAKRKSLLYKNWCRHTE